MAISRHKKTNIIKNIDEDYKKIFSSRFGPTGLIQNTTTNIKMPTEEQKTKLSYNVETWGLGQRLYNLSFKYYGDAQYWWLIALFNNIPTEAEISFGDQIKIPVPLDLTLNLYGF